MYVLATASWRAWNFGGAGSTESTLTSKGRRSFRPSRIWRGASVFRAFKWATWARAWTPASVRPAPPTAASSPKRSRAACASAAWTVLSAFFCVCQPW